jgi:hypothetical protein
MLAVAIRMKAAKVTARDINIVILQPHFSRTNPATRAEKMAPRGVALARRRKLKKLIKRLQILSIDKHTYPGHSFQR